MNVLLSGEWAEGAQWYHTDLPPLRSQFESCLTSSGKTGNFCAICWRFTVLNLDQLYVLALSALPTICYNITDKVLGVT